jgi:hypothetical protein
MSARIRAEAGMAIGYLIALPFVVILAGMVQFMAFDWMSPPGVPHWLAMLGSGIAGVLTSALSFMVIRLCLQEFASGVPAARWPIRLAPILLSAAALTITALVEALEDGGIEALTVMPPIIIFGAAAGECLVHGWLARGRDASRLFGRFFLFAFAGIAWFAIARWVLNTPRAEATAARARCEEAHALAPAHVDQQPIFAAGERTCAQA